MQHIYCMVLNHFLKTEDVSKGTKENLINVKLNLIGDTVNNISKSLWASVILVVSIL